MDGLSVFVVFDWWGGGGGGGGWFCGTRGLRVAVPGGPRRRGGGGGVVVGMVFLESGKNDSGRK